MASIRDLIFVLRGHGVWPTIKRIYTEVNEDNVFTNAAAMAYAWVFAIFPFFIFLLALVPYIPEQYRQNADKAVDYVLTEAQVPAEPAKFVKQIVSDVTGRSHAGGLLSLGLLLTLYAASGGMNTTMTSLDQAFDVEKPRKYFIKRLWAMVLTVFVCAGALIIVILLPIGSQVEWFLLKYAGELPDSMKWMASGTTLFLLTVARYVIGLTVMQIMIGIVYHFGRSQRDRLRFFTPGSIFTAGGWITLGTVMRIYFENYANYSKTYGTVAGMVVLLLIFYLDSIIFLVGAEIDSEVQHAKSELQSHFREDPAMSRPHA